MKRRGFTLVELLVVVGIMGFMGVVAVGGYQAMRRGMEERSVMENANQFIRTAYQRAQIERTPVSVFFWNETLEDLSDFAVKRVVGRAIAVRMRGRVTGIAGDKLYDEFGDLQFEAGTDGGASPSSGKRDAGRYLYRMGEASSAKESGENNFQRSLANPNTMRDDNPTVEDLVFGGVMKKTTGEFYWKILDKGGVNWKNGDAYGLEFANLSLPYGFIYGSSYSNNKSKPQAGFTVLRFIPGSTRSGSIDIYSLRTGKDGKVSPHKLGSTKDPSKDRDDDVKDLRK